jgi:hypothetical protein
MGKDDIYPNKPYFPPSAKKGGAVRPRLEKLLILALRKWS